MKSVKKNLLEETMDLLARYAYKVHYVPPKIIEDYDVKLNNLKLLKGNTSY